MQRGRRYTGRNTSQHWRTETADAMSLMPSLAAWWEPGLGMTVSETYVNNGNTFSAWVNQGCIVTPEQTDPLGGSAASRVVGVSDLKRIYSPEDSQQGPALGKIWLKTVDGDNVVLYTSTASPAVSVNLTTGECTPASNITASSASRAGGWDVTVYDSGAAATGANFQIWISGTGSGVDCYTAQIIQHRCSALADQSGNGYHLSQAVATSQIFVQKSDGTSPGGCTFMGKAAVWQPNDVAKTAACATAGLLTVMTGDHTIVADVVRLATPTAAVPIVATAGGVAWSCGLDTANKPYIACGTTLTAPDAIGTSHMQVAFVWNAATNEASIYVAGALVAGPTVLTPGGSVSPTSVTVTARCTAYRAIGIGSSAATAPQVAAVSAALAAA